jgi:putative ABC transport system permease protein
MSEVVLSSGEIIRLKHYIDHKHEGLHPQQRTNILANAVHRTIESRLPSFPAVVKKQLRHELLMNNREFLSIEVDDVLQQCMSLDLTKEDFLSPLASWVCNNSSMTMEEEGVRHTLLGWSQEANPTVGFQALESELNSSIVPVRCMEITPAHEPIVSSRRSILSSRRLYISAVVFFVGISLFILIFPLDQQSPTLAPSAFSLDTSLPIIGGITAQYSTSGIPMKLRYVPVDTKRLQQYLLDKNSILADEPFMSAIIKASKQYDVHPLLLFAITGQEQGFVPKSHTEVAEIANNPFNVFGSWESYNTTIESSAKIAAKTVANISSRRPQNTHPIQWLNATYAEDPNWWKGVTFFFDKMLQEIQDDSFVWPE